MLSNEQQRLSLKSPGMFSDKGKAHTAALRAGPWRHAMPCLKTFREEACQLIAMHVKCEWGAFGVECVIDRKELPGNCHYCTAASSWNSTAMCTGNIRYAQFYP